MNTKYSIIVPVYNRPNEVDELLLSLSKQTLKDFELILVEDGSTESSEFLVEKYRNFFEIHYFFKANTGPSDSRNYGMERASGSYFIFFDSDCVIPADYFEKVEQFLSINQVDAFGGPDNAHSSFTDIQKAINFAMTSILTTGGVRGKENKLDNYQPRSFNMGIQRKVFEEVGGFRDIHPGEDPDLSYRIMNAGFKIALISDAYVYHKRRIDFSKFIKQVYKFGVTRVILMKWYPEKSKLVYFFPSLYLLFTLLSLVLTFVCWIFILPFALINLILLVEATIKLKNLKIVVFALLASNIQLLAYGFGFLKSFVKIKILSQQEREAFPTFFRN